MVIRIAAYGANVSLDQYKFLRCRYTYFSGNTNCYLWSKGTSRPVRIVALSPWHIVRAIYIAAFEANEPVDQYVILRSRHDILIGRYILLTTG